MSNVQTTTFARSKYREPAPLATSGAAFYGDGDGDGDGDGAPAATGEVQAQHCIQFDPRVRRGVTVQRKNAKPFANHYNSTRSDAHLATARQTSGRRSASSRSKRQPWATQQPHRDPQVQRLLLRKRQRKTWQEIHDGAVVPKEHIPVSLVAHLEEQPSGGESSGDTYISSASQKTLLSNASFHTTIVRLGGGNAQSPAKCDASTQWDEFEPKPQAKPFIPRKMGDKDTAVQTEPRDIFDEGECAGFVATLAAKSLAQALDEVRAEECEKALKGRAAELRHEKHVEEQKVRRLEELEARKYEAELKRRENVRLKKAAKLNAERRLACNQLAKDFMARVEELTFHELKRDGLMHDGANTAVQRGFMPWLEAQTEKRVEQESKTRKFVEDLLRGAAEQHRREMNKVIRLLFVVDADAATATAPSSTPTAGPLDMRPAASVAQVLDSLRAWMREHRDSPVVEYLQNRLPTGTDVCAADSPLELVLDGDAVLPRDKTLLELDLHSESNLKVRPKTSP